MGYVRGKSLERAGGVHALCGYPHTHTPPDRTASVRQVGSEMELWGKVEEGRQLHLLEGGGAGGR